MKREIKFRGKSLKTGNWLVGDLRNPNIEVRNRVFIFPLNEYASIDSHEVNPGTVGQFTGLKDKYGKEIYEGDLLKYATLEPSIVEYWGGSFGYWLNKGERFQSFMSYAHSNFEFNSPSQQSFEHEVVGNIHDNPELVNE